MRDSETLVGFKLRWQNHFENESAIIMDFESDQKLQRESKTHREVGNQEAMIGKIPRKWRYENIS